MFKLIIFLSSLHSLGLSHKVPHDKKKLEKNRHLELTAFYTSNLGLINFQIHFIFCCISFSISLSFSILSLLSVYYEVTIGSGILSLSSFILHSIFYCPLTIYYKSQKI